MMGLGEVLLSELTMSRSVGISFKYRYSILPTFNGASKEMHAYSIIQQMYEERVFCCWMVVLVVTYGLVFLCWCQLEGGTASLSAAKDRLMLHLPFSPTCPFFFWPPPPRA